MTTPGRVTIKVESRELTAEESRQIYQRPGEDAGSCGGGEAREHMEQMRRPLPDRLRSQDQGFLRRAARDLLRELDRATGPDDQETREMLRDVAAVIEARRDEWPVE